MKRGGPDLPEPPSCAPRSLIACAVVVVVVALLCDDGPPPPAAAAAAVAGCWLAAGWLAN